MRLVRAIAGILLLLIGLPMLLVGGPLGAIALRGDVRPAWLDAAGWLLLAGGAIGVALGVAILAWPTRPRPREVVFVVEPSQVPVLAARIGVCALSEIGRPDPAESSPQPPPPPLQLAAIAEPAGTVVALPLRPAVPAVAELAGVSAPGRVAALVRPASLADSLPSCRPDDLADGRSLSVPAAPDWPPLTPPRPTPPPLALVPARSDPAARPAPHAKGCKTVFVGVPAPAGNIVPERQAADARRRNEANRPSPT
jgi:hypothetical protein